MLHDLNTLMDAYRVQINRASDRTAAIENNESEKDRVITDLDDLMSDLDQIGYLLDKMNSLPLNLEEIQLDIDKLVDPRPLDWLEVQ